MSTRFDNDFEVEVKARFYCWCLVEAMKFNLGRDSEARVGQDFEVEVCRNADVSLRFWSWGLVEILKMKFDQDLSTYSFADPNVLHSFLEGGQTSGWSGESPEIWILI